MTGTVIPACAFAPPMGGVELKLACDINRARPMIICLIKVNSATPIELTSLMGAKESYQNE